MTVPVHGLPPMLHEGLRVACVPPALKGDRWHEVLHVTNGGGAGQLVALSGVDGIAAAEDLTGCTMLADVADLPEDFELHDVDALLGRDVTDKVYGHIGQIVEIMVGQANDVWVIEGPYGEVLIPIVDEVGSEVPADGEIVVHAPTGTIASGRSD